MKQLFISVFVFATTFLCVFTPETRAQKIYLQPCLKLCVVFMADQSGSMDSASTDVQYLARSMTLIPSSTGYVEVGVYSFKSYFMEWTEPTGDRKQLLDAVDSLCANPTSGGTNPNSGLDYIHTILSLRRIADSTERQVILIDSDYHWDEFQTGRGKIKKLLSNGVIVILALPQKYDGCRDHYDIHEENLNSLVADGCISIRSNFRLFKEFLGKLKAIVPCG